MTADTRKQVRGVLLVVLLVTSLAAVATPASAGVASASRSAPSSVAPSGSFTVTVTATMNGSGGDFGLSESFSGPVDGATIDSVTVDGAQVTPAISTANDGGVAVLMRGLSANAQVEVTYTIEANNTSGQIEIDGEVSGRQNTISLGTDTVTVQSPAVFEVTATNAQTVINDTTVAIDADVENTGGSSATKDVELLVDGSLVSSKSTSISPGGLRNVDFTYVASTTGSHSYTVRTPDDSESGSFTIQSSNGAPTADAGSDRTVTAGSSIELDATGSTDPDGDSLDYYWNGSQHLSDRNTATPTFQAPSVSSQQTFQLNLLVTDPSGASDGDSVTITVEPSVPGTDLDGDGLHEDVNGDGTFGVSDPLELNVSYTDPAYQNNAQYFDFDGDGDLDGDDVCALYAEAGTTPSSCQQSTGSATFSVTSVSAPSSVTAGDTLSVEATVENTGSAGGSKAVELVFDGSVVETNSVTVGAGNQTTVQFDYDTTNLAAGTYSYEVSTPDDSATGSVTLQSSTGGNSAPTADAGFDRTVGSGETVELDGTGSSDPDGDALTYTWTRQDTGDTYSGATPTLEAPTVDSTTSFDVELTVSDGTASDTDTVTVTVDPGNRAPTADAGPNRTVVAGENVTLDGSNSSDPDGDSIAPNWRQPSGPTVYVPDTLTTTFEAPAVSEVRTLKFELEVSDGAESDTDTAVVTVRPAAAVTMNDQESEGGQVTVASARLADGGFVAVHESSPDGPVLGVSGLLDAGEVADVTVELDEPLPGGTHSVVAVAYRDSDGDGTFEPVSPYGAETPISDRANVTVPNEPPTADAGPDRSTRVGEGVTLDGSGSSDPDGDDLTYEWRQVEGPSAELVNASGPTARVVPEAAGTVVIELDVSDGNATATDTVAVEVTERETTATATSTPTTASPTATPTTASPTATPTPTTTAPTTTTATPAPTTTAAGSGGNGGDGGLAGMDVPMMPVAGGATALVALLLVGAVWRRRGDDDEDGGVAAGADDGGDDAGLAAVDADDDAGVDEGDTPDGDDAGASEDVALEDALLPEDDGGAAREAGDTSADADAAGDDSGVDAGTGADASEATASERATDETGVDETAADGTDADEAGAGTPASATGAAGAAGATGDDGDGGSDAPSGFSYDDIEKGERIGGGGNADVYRGSLPGPHGTVDVAIKEPRIRGTISAADVEQVLAEAETWHKLDDHEGVVDVLGWGSEPLPWIAMEYMDGGNLADAVPLPFDRGQAVLMSVASAVEYAHRAGVAHGDLKPANVLFAGDPARHGVAKVGDWGLAKVLLEQSRSTEGLSPAYAAPEQFEGGTRDIVGPQLTDVYQLGAVAYEVFTGRPPFEGTPFEVMESIKSDEPIPPTAVDPGLPAAVDEVVLTAMAKDPDERYETMTDFRRALEDL